MPALPEGSPAPPEDALAFFREAHEFRNVRFAEVVNGDFAEATVRVLLFSIWRLAVFERLRTSRDHVLAAVATKGVKELAYHRDYAARWFVTLARGTEESRARLVAALDALWPLWPELFDTHPVEAAAAASGVGRGPGRASASPPRRCSTRSSPPPTWRDPRPPAAPACSAGPGATACTARR